MKKILLINDSAFENIIMKDILETIDCKVEVSNEFEAFAVMDKFEPSIVIANLVMKETTGDVLLNKMKIEHPELKTILSSCSSVKLKDLRENKIDYFIQIPVKKDEIEKVLSKFDSKIETQMVNTIEIEQKKIKFCAFCGENLKDLSLNSKFCPYCGHKI